jgi:hypothetical protein
VEVVGPKGLNSTNRSAGVAEVTNTQSQSLYPTKLITEITTQRKKLTTEAEEAHIKAEAPVNEVINALDEEASKPISSQTGLYTRKKTKSI